MFVFLQLSPAVTVAACVPECPVRRNVCLGCRGEAGDLEDGESYDWFFGYARMAVHLNEHVGGAREGRVLVLGCGNSEISPRMWQDGWK